MPPKKTMTLSDITVRPPGGPVEPQWKYNEGNLINEVRNYVASTYNKHYVGKNNIQAMDLILSSGHGEGFCIGDIIKYSARYGKKGGKERDDILKIIHYGLFLLHDYDLQNS